MEVKTIEECLKFRLLRNIAPSVEKSKKSLELSKRNLEDAVYFMKENKDALFKFTITSSYMAMFHAARAVLYKDGIQEKSHYAVFIYLKEKYSSIVSLSVINLLNIHRTERHEAMYGLEYKPNREDAKEAVKDAKIFIKEMEGIIGKKR